MAMSVLARFCAFPRAAGVLPGQAAKARDRRRKLQITFPSGPGDLRKQREYRKIIPLDQWKIPGGLGEEIMTLLDAYAPPEIAQMAEQVQESVARTADEAMSLGRTAC